MTYLYLYLKNYYWYASIGWLCVYSILYRDDFSELFAGQINSMIVVRLILLILIPISFIALGLYLKNIRIITNDKGITFSSWFKNVFVKWEEIEEVKREDYGKVKILSRNNSFSFRPRIASSTSDKKFNPRENNYKQCELLKEIFLKVKNVPFKKFPKGTFDELKAIKSSQKTNA